MDKELRTELAIHRQAERRIHAKLVDEIERCTKYVLHKTGYVGDGGKPLLAVFFPRCKSKTDNSHECSRKVRRGRTVDSILGFVEGGVITDVWVGLLTRGYETMLIDDLVALMPMAEKLTKKILNDKHQRSDSPREEKVHT
jgi:hypothetical protein